MTISAKIVADSIGEHAPRLTTLQLRYPKFIHGEFMTHRVFSRNASSSRAIPVERLIKDVIEDPVYPSHWGANQKGMQASEECDSIITDISGDMWWGASDPTRREAWDLARDHAVHIAQAFTNAGYHKQIVNRLLEPFCHINVVVTATEWSNFFALRCHKDAQPEMRLLAEAIRAAMAASEPVLFRNPIAWHLPYVTGNDMDKTDPGHDENVTLKYPDDLIKLSVARCARVSYLTQEGKTPTVEEDLTLYERLAGSVPLHASPMEHQATPDIFHSETYTITTPSELTEEQKTRREMPVSIILNGRWDHPNLHGNLRGWVQYRKTLPGECQ